MDLVCEMLKLTSAAALGLLMGALLAEGVLFVPYWRTLAPPEFFALHKEFGPRLYRFFAPLTIGATSFSVLAAVACVLAERPGRWATLAAGVLAGSMVVIYFLYFKGGNARFAGGRLTADELALELDRWAWWHSTRVVLGILAFLASLWGLNASR